eukprot:2412314-Lingulodinium_polyedra.AAC.1
MVVDSCSRGRGAQPPQQVVGHDCEQFCTVALADLSGGRCGNAPRAGCHALGRCKPEWPRSF